MGFLLGWNSPKTVEVINSVCEYSETISLAVAIALELSGMRLSSDVAWVVLVVSDIGRQVYGRREKRLHEAEAAKLHVSLADRRLTPEQSGRISKLLSVFPGQVVNVFENGMLGEAMRFSRDIQGALIKAGWTMQFAGTLLARGPERPGVFVLIVPPEFPAAGALAGVLASEGFLATCTWDGGFCPTPTPPGVILLFVGEKPGPVTPPQA
jgi:hypothetical protein